jgi:hypothetical protein
MNPATELHAVKSALETETQEQQKELRGESDRLERQLVETKIPDDLDPQPVAVEVPDPVTVELHEELAAVKTQLAEIADGTREERQKELRDKSDRLERQLVETKIPEDLNPPPAVEPPDPTAELRDELAQVKAQLVELSEMLAIMRKNAEEADKDPEGRSVDPLRKRSEELALEVVSDGMSLRKPPVQAIQPVEPVDVEALRRQSRDLMLQILSITTE